MTAASARSLSRSECFELLAGTKVGRVAVSVRALPAIVPVCCMLLDQDVVVQACDPNRSAAALLGTIVAFEADAVDVDGETAWSVQVVGLCEPIVDPGTIAGIARKWPGRAFADDAPVARIPGYDVTGYRFEPFT